MVKAALSSVVLGMTPLATSLVESEGKRSAIQAGRGSTALKQFACLAVMSNMDFVKSLGNANAELVGKDVTAMNASGIQVVFMVPVNSLGSAIARKVGVAFSVIKISITVLTISLARTVPLAPTLAKEATPVLAVLVTLAPTARLKSMNVMPILARTEEAAQILKTAFPVPAHLAFMGKTVSWVQ